jgi:four helix bundle protein
MENARVGKLEHRTKRFAIDVIKLYGQLPRSTVAQVLGRQLLRSGTSVGAQYCEAMRAKSIADFVSKIEGSLQEIEETRYWLDLLVESNTMPSSAMTAVRSESSELVAMLVASVRTAKKRRSA